MRRVRSPLAGLARRVLSLRPATAARAEISEQFAEVANEAWGGPVRR